MATTKAKTVKKVTKKAVKAVKAPSIKVVEEAVKIHPKLVTEPVVVCKDENGLHGHTVQGIVSGDGKSVTTLAGVTYAI